MLAYIARRLLLMIPTVFGIMLVSFVIVQFAPGGPVERIIAQLQGLDGGNASRLGGGGADIGSAAAGPGRGERRIARNTAAPRVSTRNSSRISKSSSASTSPPMSASGS